MRDQLERDRQAVTIASALALFILVLVIGGVFALIVGWVAEPSAGLGKAFAIVTLVAATAISLRYLVSHRRP